MQVIASIYDYTWNYTSLQYKLEPSPHTHYQVRMAANGEDLTEGPLSKWTNKLSGWQYRWFVLDSKSGHMSYYTVRNRSV